MRNIDPEQHYNAQRDNERGTKMTEKQVLAIVYGVAMSMEYNETVIRAKNILYKTASTINLLNSETLLMDDDFGDIKLSGSDLMDGIRKRNPAEDDYLAALRKLAALVNGWLPPGQKPSRKDVIDAAKKWTRKGRKA
jgi:hypothetical protein